MVMKNNNSYQSYKLLTDSPWIKKGFKSLLWGALVATIIIMFLPWTQNIQSTGSLTTLKLNDRPQEIQSRITGRIEKWNVMEGDFVKKGDTIVVISEIKENYLDPNLIAQTGKQLAAKENSVISYSSKIRAIEDQLNQLEINAELKLKQAINKLQQDELKLKSENAELDAANTAYNIARTQYLRDSMLQKKNIKSTLEVENRRNKMQETLAKKISASNKVEIAISAVENARFEIRNIKAEYSEKIAKTEGEKFSAISNRLESEYDAAKLQNTVNNYSIRNGFYTITAPQDGYISRAMINGIGETIKEGYAVCSIMPADANLAVELFINPVDMPLIHKGNHVRFVFDGWPTIVFSGWPNFTFGTFPGEVVAVDNIPSKNGKYRVLVKPEKGRKPWPKQLRVGTGARGYLLMNRVRVWYEIWRQLNGFPADYYKKSEDASKLYE